MAEVDNPWLNISWQNTIADCDREYIIAKYGGVSEYEEQYSKAELKLSCLPEPYSGNKDSKVYCLNMNPGEAVKEFDKNESFERETKKNLAHAEGNDCYWFRRVLDSEGFPHPGLFWVYEKTKPLRKLLKERPNIFFIEYFPYHSKNGNGIQFPTDLPSYEYSNQLIEAAMKEEKHIIIMRKEEMWYERIKSLRTYSRLIVLKNSYAGWISPGNFSYPNSKEFTKEEIIKMFEKKK